MNWIKKAAASIPGVGTAVAAIEVVDMIGGGGGANGGGGSDKSIKFLESSVNSRIDSIKDQINLKDSLNETKNVFNAFQTEVNRTTSKMEKEITSNFQSVSQATSQLRQDAFTQIGNVHSNLSESLKQTASKFQQDLSLETEKLERSCTQKIDMESKKLGDSINKVKNDAIEEISKNEQEVCN
uniref:Uncharacterized protein n=1 Tax=Panagrolaimus davidi TaxID=227884 RepID=A0A914PCN5_9BILA